MAEWFDNPNLRDAAARVGMTAEQFVAHCQNAFETPSPRPVVPVARRDEGLRREVALLSVSVTNLRHRLAQAERRASQMEREVRLVRGNG
jgi:hypothetical protein